MDLIQPLFKSGHSTSAPTGMNGRRVKISSRMGDLWSGVCSEFLNILPQSEDWLPTCRSQVVRPRPLKFIVGAFEKDFIRRKRAHLDVLSGESMFVDVPTDDKVNVFKELPPVGDVINHISRFELELDYYGNLVLIGATSANRGANIGRYNPILSPKIVGSLVALPQALVVS